MVTWALTLSSTNSRATRSNRIELGRGEPAATGRLGRELSEIFGL
jgi:hypothetical protein